MAAGWWLRRWRWTYLRDLKRREHIRHINFGALPCRTSIWRFSELCLENVKSHSLQTRSSSRPRYLSGRRWGCMRVRWLIKLDMRVNWHPQPSHVRWNLRSCSCRWWVFSVSALPSTLPHCSQRCSVTPRWTVEMWSVSCASEAKIREQYSQIYDFCAWSHIVNMLHHNGS